MSLKGEILINGVARNDEKFRRISAYVLQDDNLYPHMTVLETFTLAAAFYLPADSTSETRADLVDAVINELALGKTRDTIIGNEKVRGVSGGERKRVSIGVQLISDPAVLFLDEPTSGLDSFQALSVMESMKALSENGRLVMSVIHQPRSSIFHMFDRLLLLSEGRVMYFGVSSAGVKYFGARGHQCPANFNPADFFLDILSPDNRSPDVEKSSSTRIKYLGDDWLQNGIKSPEMKALLAQVQLSVAKSSKNIKSIGDNNFDFVRFRRNFLLLAWRAWAEQSRDIATFAIKMTFSVFFALIIGGIYSNIGHRQNSIQNRVGLLFFVTIQMCFNAIVSVLNTFPKETSIVSRERSNRAYDTFSYFAAKVFTEIPLNAIPTVVYACILYWIVGLNPSGDRVGIFILILIFLGFAAVSLGLGVSAFTKSIEAANALGTPLLIIGILFGGFYIDIGSLPIVANWVPYFSILRWAFEALIINEFKGLKFTCEDIAVITACITTGDEEIKALAFEGHTVNYPVFGLAMCILGFLACALFFLHNSKLTFLPLGFHGAQFSKQFTPAPKDDVETVVDDEGKRGSEQEAVVLQQSGIEV